MLNFFLNNAKVVLFLILIFSSYLKTLGQKLNVGDKVPEIEFNEVFNHNTEHFKLSDYRGKLIILDFWGVFCGSCLEGFKKVDSLQQEFNDRIQFITVNSLDKEGVKAFFEKRKHIFLPRVPFVTGDTILKKLFPHQGVPFHVWIDPEGKLLFTADAFNLTRKNISAALNGSSLNLLPVVNNIYVNTLLDERWKGLPDFASYIYRMPYKTPVRLNGETINRKMGLTASGSILELYKIAYEGASSDNYSFSRPGRVVLKVGDHSKYIKPENLNGLEEVKWVEDNFYQYQLVVPEDFKGNIYKIMMEDLNRYFNIKARIFKRKIKIYSLIRTSEDDKILSKGGEPFNSFISQDIRTESLGSWRKLNNKPFRYFSNSLRGYFENVLKVPFKDETGYTKNIDITFSGESLDHLSIDGLKKELKKYNLNIIEKAEIVKALELSE